MLGARQAVDEVDRKGVVGTVAGGWLEWKDVCDIIVGRRRSGIRVELRLSSCVHW
jgi:hypothetical protein